jgi:glucose/arabinose dehydrogenase
MRTRTLTAVSVLLTLLLAASMLPAGAGELPPGGTFWDDNGNTHEGFIEAIAAVGVTEGCDSTGRYCPSQSVTREQMATFLARALDLEPVASGPFSDVSGTHAGNVNAIAEAGISLGCNAEGTLFCPVDPVRRDQMASFLARALDDLSPATGDAFTDDDGNTHEDAINIVAANGITLGCDASGTLYCPEDLVPRDQMASFLGRALGLTEVDVPPGSNPTAELVTSAVSQPVLVTAPDSDPRLFIVEKGGTISIVENGSLLGTKFLNISSLVSTGSEQGLLGMAFHPNYNSNGLFYVSYTDTAGDTRIMSYSVSSDPNLADPNSSSQVLFVDQPVSNHNGGNIAFGEDGYLYIGLGDGGGGGDPSNNAENPNNLLGAMLRIDVDGDAFPGDSAANYAIPSDNPFVGSSAGRDEIWAYGLRNPWRWSIDSVDDLIYIADVGQDRYEEVNVAPVSAGGVNYGWDILEGSSCYEPSSGCSSAGTQLPVLEYSHSVGRSVTGGYVYRGSAMPDLVGTYFYGDAASGWVKSFRYVNGTVTQQRDWPNLGIGGVWSFGEDAAGELYIVTSGAVYKIVP